LALGAGFMLAVSFFDVLPKVVLIWQKRNPENPEDLAVPDDFAARRLSFDAVF
jgi:hypothetical protein